MVLTSHDWSPVDPKVRFENVFGICYKFHSVRKKNMHNGDSLRDF
jgi:hypothetical protein